MISTYDAIQQIILLPQLEIKQNNEEKKGFQIKLAEIGVRVGQMTGIDKLMYE